MADLRPQLEQALQGTYAFERELGGGGMSKTYLVREVALDRQVVKDTVGDWLTGSEIDAMLKRRDLLVAHFKRLIAELGEDKVLY